MARLIWTEPALLDLDAIADYISLDKPEAAKAYVRRVFEKLDRLERYPRSGKRVPELPGMVYREVVVPPCRIFYRVDGEKVYILHVMRSERLLREHLLELRDSDR
ncbi:MAG: type II toxin-antitoxin system RelE/ParE family toxin [Candidatus Hydrogenedentes bacterium]|nr:type II toxin-antitoxin system RelE/ParE family toxin [Candidatus Hydrogenedentota bacterium]